MEEEQIDKSTDDSHKNFFVREKADSFTGGPFDTCVQGEMVPFNTLCIFSGNQMMIGNFTAIGEVIVRLNRPKGSVIIQNDVWVGHGATIMAGVTLHNGCVVAANAVVTKDVPPYAIVSGNPAKILRYRFDETTITALQIAENTKARFCAASGGVCGQISAGSGGAIIPPNCPRTVDRAKKAVLFIPDFSNPHPLHRKVLEQYFAIDHPDMDLLIYAPELDLNQENSRVLHAILGHYEKRDCGVILQTEKLDEHILFQYTDAFITARDWETVFRTCLADLYQVKILYGTDEPFFSQ